ncbi:MAG: methyl-accepting chemotaxis protein [Chromatiaceae bacterium]|nr:methyl-accepting chemotaxis protein [Chromatiaceae bacterium]
MRTLSLRLKLLLATGLLLVLTAAVIIALATLVLRDSATTAAERMRLGLSQQTEEVLREAALGTSEEVQRLLSEPLASAAVLHQQIQGSAVWSKRVPFERDQVRQLVEDSIRSNPAISAIYAQFEANGYDGSDIHHRGNLDHSSETGTLEIYFVWEDGELVFYPTEDADEKYDETPNEFGQPEAEWYFCPRDRRQTCLIDPYLYEISEGYEELMTSITLPVIVRDRFIGVVGIDINLSGLQEAVERIAARLFDGQGDLTLTSESGLIAASSRFSQSLGRPLSEVDAGLVDVITASGLVKGEELWHYSLPIQIEGVAQRWTLNVSVPQSVILDAATQLEQALRENAGQATWRLAGIALLMTLAALVVMVVLLRGITQPLGKLALGMESLASSEGDLTQKVMIHHHRELISLAQSINRFIDKLRQMILAMKDQSHILASNSNVMSGYAARVQDAATSQSNQIGGIVTAMTQLSSSASEVSALANLTVEDSRQTAAQIDHTQQALQRTTARVEQLSQSMDEASGQIRKVAERSQAIYSILETIRDIAGQTNLLALNAAIEAARAGEQGRGFAVVAEEVRNLASRTQHSTTEVDALIQGLGSDVEQAVQRLNGTHDEMRETHDHILESTALLDQAVGHVKQIDAHALQVATAAEEQSQVSEHINRGITAIGDAAHDLSQLAQDTEALAQATHATIQDLDQQLGLLKVQD